MSCQSCTPDIPNANPPDNAPGSAYFAPTTDSTGCTPCATITGSNPPDGAVGGGDYFENPPTPLFPSATVESDEQTAGADCGDPVTIPAGAIGVYVAVANPISLAAAKIQANAMALTLAESEVVIIGGTITDSFCGSASYSKTFCVPLAAAITISSGVLPDGLSVSRTGALSAAIYGFATVGGTFNFTITATPATGSPVNYTVTLNILNIVVPPVITGHSGDHISIQLIAAAPIGAVLTWSAAPGTLPTNLSLSSSGLLSGTLTVAIGAIPFTVTVSDSMSGLTCSRTLTAGSGNPFTGIIWARAPIAGYSAAGIKVNTNVTAPGNTGCGGVVDGSGKFSFDYCSGSPGGRLLCTSGGLIPNLIGGYACRIRITFGTDFNSTGSNFQISVNQTSGNAFSGCWSNPAGGPCVLVPNGTTITTPIFFIGNSGGVTIGLTYDVRDLRGDPSVHGEFMGPTGA